MSNTNMLVVGWSVVGAFGRSLVGQLSVGWLVGGQLFGGFM